MVLEVNNFKDHAERMQANLMPKRQSSQQKAGMTEGTTISSATEGVDTPPPPSLSIDTFLLTTILRC